jgi:hypothetical protein
MSEPSRPAAGGRPPATPEIAGPADPAVTALDATIGALNAVVGDYLARRANALAIEMAFYHEGRPLAMDEAALRAAYPDVTDKICLLIHGLGATEGCWCFADEPISSYGSRLRQDLGFTPLYLRYNSGLRVSRNGRTLAELLERLVACYPTPLSDLTLIGHSLGGLLIRSACHYGAQLGHRWPAKLRRAFYLGSPHRGAPLEKIGHLLSVVLRVFDEPVVRLVRQVLDQRSAGIKDLRHGNLVDEDWEGHDPQALFDNRRTQVPLHPDAAHYIIGSTLTDRPDHLVARLFGDAMVRVPSALGQAAPHHGSPRLPPNNVKLLGGIGHLALAHHAEIYRQIRCWCEEEARSGCSWRSRAVRSRSWSRRQASTLRHGWSGSFTTSWWPRATARSGWSTGSLTWPSAW